VVGASAPVASIGRRVFVRAATRPRSNGRLGKRSKHYCSSPARAIAGASWTGRVQHRMGSPDAACVSAPAVQSRFRMESRQTNNDGQSVVLIASQSSGRQVTRTSSALPGLPCRSSRLDDLRDLIRDLVHRELGSAAGQLVGERGAISNNLGLCYAMPYRQDDLATACDELPPPAPPRSSRHDLG
jgi:hypothetical protein